MVFFYTAISRWLYRLIWEYISIIYDLEPLVVSDFDLLLGIRAPAAVVIIQLLQNAWVHKLTCMSHYESYLTDLVVVLCIKQACLICYDCLLCSLS